MIPFTILVQQLSAVRARRVGTVIPLALVLAFLGCSGCYSTWDVAPNEVTKLQSFRAPEEVQLKGKDGDSFTFDRGTTLLVSGGRPDGYRFESIEEADGTLSGKTVDGVHIKVESSDIKATKFSVSKTVAVSVGVTLGVSAVAALFVGGMALSKMGGMGGGISLGGGCAAAISAGPRGR